jgi:predicted RNA-binding Zn-ribbon protein involved in translation (DUF1610 family)
MQNAKYVCPECGYQTDGPGLSPNCLLPLVASCPTCGNPIVGEQVKPYD